MDDDKDIEIENTLIETEESDEAEDLEEIDGVIGEPLNIEDIDIEVPQYVDESVSGTSLVRMMPCNTTWLKSGDTAFLPGRKRSGLR